MAKQRYLVVKKIYIKLHSISNLQGATRTLQLFLLSRYARLKKITSVDPSLANVMPAVHSRRENPRQRESENVNGNTRLGCSRVALGALVLSRQLSLFQQSVVSKSKGHVPRLTVAPYHTPKSTTLSKPILVFIFSSFFFSIGIPRYFQEFH